MAITPYFDDSHLKIALEEARLLLRIARKASKSIGQRIPRSDEVVLACIAQNPLNMDNLTSIGMTFGIRGEEMKFAVSRILEADKAFMDKLHRVTIRK